MTLYKILCFLIILMILIGAAVFQHIYIINTSEELIALTGRINDLSHISDTKNIKENYALLKNTFQKNSRIYRALLDHSFICDVNEQMYVLENAIYLNNMSQISSCCANLEYTLICIYDLETVTVDNIF